MWKLTRRRTLVTRVAAIPEFDLPLITALILAKAPGLALGHEGISPHHGLGSIARFIIGTSSDELEWLEAANTALGGQAVFMPIRRANRSTVDLEAKVALTDSLADVAHAFQQAAEGDAILAGERSTGRPDTDRELRRIVDEGRGVRRRSLDRDFLIAQRYAADHTIDQAAVTDRAADRRRYEELRDEYELMNGGAPTTWPF